MFDNDSDNVQFGDEENGFDDDFDDDDTLDIEESDDDYGWEDQEN